MLSSLIFLIGGSLISGLFLSSLANGSDEQAYQNEYNFNTQQVKDQKEADLSLLDLQFDIDQKNALHEADKLDTTTNFKENDLSNSFNTELDNLINQQEAEAFGWNVQAMQNGVQTGSELANLANSGIRSGSSLSNAVEMESAVNSAQLQLQEDSARKSESNMLGNLFNGLGSGQFDIWNNRDNADYTRSSWNEGGDQWNLYQKRRANTELTYDQKLAQLDYDYNDYMSDKSRRRRVFGNAFGFANKIMNTSQSLMSLY